MQLLHFRNNQVSLREETSDLQLVCFGTLPEDAAGEVDGGDLEDGELGGGNVDAPTLGLDFDDATDDEVTNLGCIAGAEGPNGEEFVGFRKGASEGGGDGGGSRRNIGAVATKAI